jgi:hypothetical protein
MLEIYVTFVTFHSLLNQKEEVRRYVTFDMTVRLSYDSGFKAILLSM